VVKGRLDSCFAQIPIAGGKIAHYPIAARHAERRTQKNGGHGQAQQQRRRKG
jgi:hypothetical protein